jgi:hypothetical protein
MYATTVCNQHCFSSPRKGLVDEISLHFSRRTSAIYHCKDRKEVTKLGKLNKKNERR